MSRPWTKEDYQYLSDNWGSKSLVTICKKLNRSENAIHVKVQRLGLGAFLDQGEYITWNVLQNTIGCTGGSGYKIKSWVENRGFPLKTKRVNTSTYKVVYIDDFWKWAEKNKDLLDFSKFEENSLGKEPTWAKAKRKHDFEKNTKYIKTPWTPVEDSRLKYLLEQQKYTYDDLSKLLRRTNGAIQRRVCDLGIKARPVKVDNHVKWTEEEFYKLGELIKEGNGYELISEKIGKSSKAIRGRVYGMYLTENLDKVRTILGSGNWGDNRPERKVKQYLLMNEEEKQQTKELLTRLSVILRYQYKEYFEASDYWQKDLCQHWVGYCAKDQISCDECLEFQRIRPQYCKRCGGTFYERKENDFCSVCRKARKSRCFRKAKREGL
ncbi:MAG: hypothetical protein AB7E42_05040 [Anaerotignaceae bacterium]